MEFQPGEYTIQWIFDQRNVGQINKLRTAQQVAYALRSLGTLAPPPPQPTDVEVVNNPVDYDSVTGVVRIRFTRVVTYEEFGAVVIETVRGAGFPGAIPHVHASPTSIFSGSLFATIGDALGITTPDIGFSDVVCGVTPGIAANVRPLLGANPVESVMAATSNRQSDDPARNGSVAVSEAAAAARGVVNTGSAALQVPQWLYIAGGIAAGVLVIAISAGIYSRLSGK